MTHHRDPIDTPITVEEFGDPGLDQLGYLLGRLKSPVDLQRWEREALAHMIENFPGDE
jgi:hypothetical protein